MACRRHSEASGLSQQRWCLTALISSAGTFGLQKLHSIAAGLSIGDQSNRIRWCLLGQFLYRSGCERQALSCGTGRGRCCCKLSARFRFLALWFKGAGRQLAGLHRMVWCNWLLAFKERFWPARYFRTGRAARAWWPHLFSRHEHPTGYRDVGFHEQSLCKCEACFVPLR
jgi:hypothetical protein